MLCIQRRMEVHLVYYPQGKAISSILFCLYSFIILLQFISVIPIRFFAKAFCRFAGRFLLTPFRSFLPCTSFSFLSNCTKCFLQNRATCSPPWPSKTANTELPSPISSWLIIASSLVCLQPYMLHEPNLNFSFSPSLGCFSVLALAPILFFWLVCFKL